MDLTTEEGTLRYIRAQDLQFSRATRADSITEGSSGSTYRIHTENGTPSSVIVKHAEGYAARAPEWKLDQHRMFYEYKALEYLSTLQLSNNPVRVPRVLYYDDQQHVLILEDVGNLPSLKAWFQPGRSIETNEAIGSALGAYLANVHNVSSGNTDLLADFNGNTTGKYASGTAYYGRLASSAAGFGFTDDYFQTVADDALKDVNESSEVFTLGDFWTGNILVDIKDNKSMQLYVLDLELAKPGFAAFDVGQMAAEIYRLAAFRDQEPGMALFRGFLTSYKKHRDGPVDAAKVAIRIGAHFVTGVPLWWAHEVTSAQVESAVELGAGLIKMGWERDEGSLRQSIVGSLL